jgi:hypothetical protein
LFQAIIEQTSVFCPCDIPTVIAKLQNYNFRIGVKKLLDLLDMVKRVEEQKRVGKFFAKLQEQSLAIPKEEN